MPSVANRNAAVGKLNMAIGDARLLADGKEIYVANDLRVGLFMRDDKGQGAAA